MGLVEYIGSIGGIAGVLAVIIFLIYRQDRKSSEDRQREDRKFMEDRLTEILGDYRDVVKERYEITLKNTSVLSELITWLKAKNGH